MTRRALAAASLAIGLAAIIARGIADVLAEIDDALAEYTVEDRTPDYVPTAWTETQS